MGEFYPKKGIFWDPPNLGSRRVPTPIGPIHMCVVAYHRWHVYGRLVAWSSSHHGGGVQAGDFAAFWLTICLATTQVGAPAQMYAMAVSEANSCKNRLLKNYKSNEETLQHTYVVVLMVLQQSQSKKTSESRTSCTRVLIILKYEGLGNLEVVRVFPE